MIEEAFPAARRLDMDEDLLDDGSPGDPVLAENLDDFERGVSITLGAALLALAFSRRRTTAAVLGLAGAYAALRGITGHCVAYEALDLVDEDAEPDDDRLSPGGHGDPSDEVALTIARPVDEVYAFWRDLGNLPRFMESVFSVTPLDETRSRWVAEVPDVGPVEWETEILADREGELIAWRALPGSHVHHSGAVRFRPAPGGRGTEVRLSMEPFSQGGRFSRWLGRVLGWGTTASVTEDLRRLKQILETGEAPTTEGQPSGRNDPSRELSA